MNGHVGKLGYSVIPGRWAKFNHMQHIVCEAGSKVSVLCIWPCKKVQQDKSESS